MGAPVITPAPSPDEAAAIAAALCALLEAGRAAGHADPRPAAYRSEWRHAAMREGAGLADDDRERR